MFGKTYFIQCRIEWSPHRWWWVTWNGEKQKKGRTNHVLLPLLRRKLKGDASAFLPDKLASLFFSTSKYFVLFLDLPGSRRKSWTTWRVSEISPVQPVCFPSLSCCVFLFYFRVRFSGLAQDGNWLAEHSMKTVPKGLQGPTLHPGKCQKALEQCPWAAAVDFCCLNVSLQMKRSWKRSNYYCDLAYSSDVMESCFLFKRWPLRF